MEDPAAVDFIARLIRVKMLRYPWDKILGQEGMDETYIAEVLSTPARFSWEEHEHKNYDYTLKLGGKKFRIIYIIETDLWKVYLDGKEFMDISEAVIEDLKGQV
jgi:hypothetical protein